jgi:hypothetical protein
MWFDTFSVRPECRALRGVSKGARKTLTTNDGYAEFPQYQNASKATAGQATFQKNIPLRPL